VTERSQRRPRDPRVIRGVMVLGHLAHMLARSRRSAIDLEPEGGPWTELNSDIQAMVSELAHRDILERLGDTDAARMIAKCQAMWPRERVAAPPARMERHWRLAEAIVGELLQDLAVSEEAQS
jgi:hypothetical protein